MLVASSRRLAAESLEPRLVLAVTAGVVGSDLQISLGAAGDKAFLVRSGGDYLISGTGLKSAVSVAVASVPGGIVVQDTAGAARQAGPQKAERAAADRRRIRAEGKKGGISSALHVHTIVLA